MVLWVGVPDLPAISIHETLQPHTNAKNWDACFEIADRIARDARVGDGVTRARGDDQGTNLEEGKAGRIDGVVPDDGHVCTKECEVLIEVPSERVKVIDHKHVQGTSEMFWE